MDTSDKTAFIIVTGTEQVQEPNQQVSAETIRLWIANPTEHNEAIVASLKTGVVRLVPADLLVSLTDRARSASDWTRKYSDEVFLNAELHSQNTLLINTIFLVLKSFEGVAAKSDVIMEIMKIAGVGEHKSKADMFGRILVNGKVVMEKGQQVMHAFDPTWLGKIDIDALRPFFAGLGFQLSGYDSLLELVHQLSAGATPPTGINPTTPPDATN